MSDIQPADAQTPFDSIRHVEDSKEYWLARELAKMLKYTRYDDFLNVVERAKVDIEQSDRSLDEHMRKIPQKSTGGRPGTDYELSAYACRLIVMAARTRDADIASKARTYFSDKVAQAEQEELGLLDDPETALEEWKERAIRSYMAHGFSEAYARNRVDGILTRKAITGKWVVSGITEEEIPILTDRQHMGTFDITTETHKGIKHFPLVKRGKKMKHVGDLRVAMTPMEQAVITFSENVTMALHDERGSYGFQEIARDVDDGSAIARDKRLEIEKLTGKPVVSERNMLNAKDGGMFGDLDAPKDEGE